MTHRYEVTLTWTGNLGEGTSSYKSYGRSFLVQHQDKPELLGSSDPQFRGDPSKWNPEELLLASIASCHMLWYLHLCSSNGIMVLEYEDKPTAIMEIEKSGSGKFIEATLHPKVTLQDLQKQDLALQLHNQAHSFCFIANSINFPIRIYPAMGS